jgi:hypothetical protein
MSVTKGRAEAGAGPQQTIGDAEVDLRSDVRLKIDVHGLIVTARVQPES